MVFILVMVFSDIQKDISFPSRGRDDDDDRRNVVCCSRAPCVLLFFGQPGCLPTKLLLDFLQDTTVARKMIKVNKRGLTLLRFPPIQSTYVGALPIQISTLLWCSRFGEVCSCCSYTALPGPAWVLLNYVLCIISRPLYLQSIEVHQGGGSYF